MNDGDMPIGGGSPVPLAMKMEAQEDRQSPSRLDPKATGLKIRGGDPYGRIRRLLAEGWCIPD
jgi:hypothetical protein